MLEGKKIKNKISLLAHVGKYGSIFDKFKLIYIPIVLKESFFSWHVGGKNKNKSWKAAFFSCRRQFLHVEGLVGRKIY